MKRLLLPVLLTLLLASCGSKGVEVTDAMISTANSDIDSHAMPDFAKWAMLKTDDGIRYLELVAGEGETPKDGDTARVHYSLWLTNGTLIDSSSTGNRPAPFDFTIGSGRVIEGWDKIVRLMRKGGRFLVEIPPSLGYGKNAVGPIPKNSKLVFAIDLLDIR